MSEVKSAVAANGHEMERPATWLRTFILLGVALLAGVGVIRWREKSSNNSYVGRLQARAAAVSADRTGRIVELLATEGSPCSRGNSLVTLRDESLEQQIVAQRKAVEKLKFDLAQAEARVEVDLAWRMKNLENELLDLRLRSAGYLQVQFDQKIEGFAMSELDPNGSNDLVETPTDVSKSNVKNEAVPTTRKEVLRPIAFRKSNSNFNLRSLLRREANQNAIEVSSTQLQMCEQRMNELKKLKDELPEQVRQSHGVSRLKAELAEQLAALKKAEANKSTWTLSATAFGTVGLYRKQRGDLVSAGQPIVDILDTDQRFVLIQIPSRKLTRFAPQQEVTLRFPGGVLRTGTIQEIPPQISPSTSNEADPLVAVRVEPTGKLWPEAPIGSMVELIGTR